MKNKFLVLEGLEGSGKTTACNIIVKFLKEKKINNIIVTHDPGGTPLADQICYFIKHGSHREIITDKAELLMFYTARLQLLENIIKPALARGTWVVGDRYNLSTWAYQGAGKNINRTLIKILQENILEQFLPDLTVYLDITPEVGLCRIVNRRKLDRIEQQSIKFFTKIRNYYLAQAKKNKNILVIDAHQPLSVVSSTLRNMLEIWWTEQCNKYNGIHG
ncbi:MAG: dTMP kinase [Candidatus Dasytiphilus stammeri]